MPHVNPTLPNDGESADAGDVSIPFLALLAIFNGHIAADNIEPGSLPWSVMDTFSNEIPASAMEDSADLELYRLETLRPAVGTGLIWAATVGLQATMTEGSAYVSGVRVKIDAVASRTFTASRDTYVSVGPSGSIGYSEVLNGATAPTLSANSMWIAIVTTNGSAITNVLQIQSNETQGLVGLGSTKVYAGFTNQGDAVYPLVGQKLVYAAKRTGSTTNGQTAAYVDYNSFTTVRFRAVAGRKYRLMLNESYIFGSGSGQVGVVPVSADTTFGGTAVTGNEAIALAGTQNPGFNTSWYFSALITGLITINMKMKTFGSPGTVTYDRFGFLTVEEY